MSSEPRGWFVHTEHEIENGQRYAFCLDNGAARPDPASRWQPNDVHQPSAFFDPSKYEWSDAGWRGIDRSQLVVYELHVGAFTPEGTFAAIEPRLPELRDLGVTAIELMPVAQFAGRRGWGYDGCYPFAVQESYGGPLAMQKLVDTCHREGIAVILDVVYNHLGPEGNYAGQFGPYFTHRHHTPWGDALNYDDSGCDNVRDFVCDNVRYWFREFHVDGLRLDAVQAIFDGSPRHILRDIKIAADDEAARSGRRLHVIAETDQNDVRLLNDADQGGYGLDAQWSDDFHHCVHTLLTGERNGYYADYGQPEQLVKSLNQKFVYDGCYSPFRDRHHGTPAGKLSPDRFVISIQNHDQVGNRARGDRFGTLLTLPRQKLAAGLMLLSPYVPMLFMGEEYGEKRPFPYFCSFGDANLIEAVRRGRREEFSSFSWSGEFPDPQSEETFRSACLSWSWPVETEHHALRGWYRDLLAARRRWRSPGNSAGCHSTWISSGTSAGEGVVEFTVTGNNASESGEIHRPTDPLFVAYFNLSSHPQPVPTTCCIYNSRENWTPVLSSELPCYGGARKSLNDVKTALALKSTFSPWEVLVFAQSEGMNPWIQV
jgi:maltooligosyltrehalose trehalohydrolase